MFVTDLELMMISLITRRMASNRVAVLLAGSGVYDGSEIHEASAALVALSRKDAQVKHISKSSNIWKYFPDFNVCARQRSTTCN